VVSWDGLRTERLCLDRPAADDVPALHAVHADPETNRHNPSGPATDLAQIRGMVDEWRQHWDEYGFGYWAVRESPDGAVIGVGGVRRRDIDGESVLNLYYRFAVVTWGHGYATELATEAVRLAARDLPGVPVVAIVHPDNVASRRVAERAGLHLVGSTRHNGGERLFLRSY
jgi:RimJ/RimL family protein N-acetyltransferase